MRSPLIPCLVAVALAAGCTTSSQVVLPPPGSTPATRLYVTTASNGNLLVFMLPLTNTSSPAVTLSGFGSARGVALDSLGHLFVEDNGPTPRVVDQFNLPITPTSTPTATIHLPTGANSNFIAVDTSNNLWVSDLTKFKVYEFVGPFSGSVTPTPTITLSSGLDTPEGLAFDSAGRLYVSNEGFGVNTVTVFNAPITDGEAASNTLTAANQPRGAAFDGSGNLYVDQSPGSIARWNGPPPFAASAAVSTTDPSANTGQSSGYGVTVDAVGNLYAADNPGNAVRVFPNVATSFSVSQMPSVTTSAAGAWGIALGN